MTLRRVLAAAIAAVAVVALAGCAEPGSPAAAPSPVRTSTSPSPLRGTIVVDAAASLSTVLPRLAAAFERAHPGTAVRFSFAGSSTLAAQIVSGAPVDVFAAASTKTMQTVAAAGLTATAPVVIARNRLEIAVPPSNPGKVTGLEDFAAAAKTIVVCDPKVPCGAAAQQVFALAEVAAKPDSLEPDVTSVLNKVELGEADAGLVYATDVLAAGSKVKGIPFAAAAKAITAYPIAPLKGSAHAALAAAFVTDVVQHGGPELRAAGFLGP